MEGYKIKEGTEIYFRKALKSLLDQKGRGSQTEIAIDAGISQSYLNQIKAGTRIGSVKTLHAIAGALGTTYEEMLKLGRSIALAEKEPGKTSIYGDFKPSRKAEPSRSAIDARSFDFVPMAEACLNAGGGSVVMSEQLGEYYAFRKDWLSKVATSARNIILMTVEGESMTPTISDGDTVMIDMGRTRIKSGSIYALGIEDTIIVKRLEYLVSGTIRIISDNRQEYAPYEANPQNIRIIGEVIWCAKQFIKTD
jgi:phage repressor protein C with HTH and peptisase S24 domain